MKPKSWSWSFGDGGSGCDYGGGLCGFQVLGWRGAVGVRAELRGAIAELADAERARTRQWTWRGTERTAWFYSCTGYE